MVGLFNQIEKNCDIILQKILFVNKMLAMNVVEMKKQTDKMMSTLIAIIGLIAVLIFCFVANAINQDFTDLYAPIILMLKSTTKMMWILIQVQTILKL
mgnify:CR=1 FL=1